MIFVHNPDRSARKFLDVLSTKISFYKSQETAPKPSQRVSKAHSKKLAKSRLQFLSRSFYLPDCYCTLFWCVTSGVSCGVTEEEEEVFSTYSVANEDAQSTSGLKYEKK